MIKKEKLSDNLDQAVKMMHDHWIELYRDGIEFNSDIDGMICKNLLGEMEYFTMKIGDELVAHIAYFIIDAPVYRSKIAIDMFYYVKPENRGSMKCAMLLRDSAKILLDSGISSVMVSQMSAANLGKIIKRAGFVSCGETFVFRG